VSVDPFGSLTGALSKTGKYTLNTFQVNFSPVSSKVWKKDAKKIIKILSSNKPKYMKNIQLHPSYLYLKLLMFPFIIL
jgi:endonuclease IV